MTHSERSPYQLWESLSDNAKIIAIFMSAGNMHFPAMVEILETMVEKTALTIDVNEVLEELHEKGALELVTQIELYREELTREIDALSRMRLEQKVEEYESDPESYSELDIPQGRLIQGLFDYIIDLRKEI